MRNWVRRGGWDLMRGRWRKGVVGVWVSKRGCVVEVWKEMRGTMGKLWF